MAESNKKLTSAAGAPVPDNQNVTTVGPRGPQLLQDVWFLEKLVPQPGIDPSPRRVIAYFNGSSGGCSWQHQRPIDLDTKEPSLLADQKFSRFGPQHKEGSMSGKAAKITVTEKQKAILQQIVNAATAAVRHAQRARIILAAFQEKLNRDMAAEVGLNRRQIGLWRRRWADSFEALIAIECRETNATLYRAIQQVLSDAPRGGAPGTFTAEQVTHILAVACEPPENSGRPINCWTHRELTDEVIRRGIVPSISKSQVGSYLQEADLQPHRSKYWLNTKEKCQETFDQQVQLVCQTYLEAPKLYSQAQTHTVSVDEMPGIQAIERIANKIPMQPGKPERIEYEYRRHGTLCLIGNWNVVTGQMIAPTIGSTRTEEDLVQHIHATIQTDPTAG